MKRNKIIAAALALALLGGCAHKTYEVCDTPNCGTAGPIVVED